MLVREPELLLVFGSADLLCCQRERAQRTQSLPVRVGVLQPQRAQTPHGPTDGTRYSC